MTYFENCRKEEIEMLKEKGKPVDATPLFKKLIESRNAPKEEKEEMIKHLKDSFEQAGQTAVHRAILEGVMTEKEYLAIKNKYRFNFSDFGTILLAYFSRKDKHVPKKEKIMVVSTPDTPIYKHRDFVKKRFGVVVITTEQATKMMKKDVERIKNDVKI